MPQGEPRCGEKYLHFKNKLYQIVTVAKHSETGEELVIYQALYGDFGVYARPLAMFISEVDHEKYPEVTQKYRFMLAETAVAPEQTACENMTEKPEQTACESVTEKAEQAACESVVEKAERTACESVTEKAEQEACESMTEKPEQTIDRPAVSQKDATQLLMDFYDAESYEEKYKILTAMREGITDVMINNMAVVLDVVISEGELDKRYEELKQCLRTYQKYETGRLR